jgi:hypothetical protein
MWVRFLWNDLPQWLTIGMKGDNMEMVDGSFCLKIVGLWRTVSYSSALS